MLTNTPIRQSPSPNAIQNDPNARTAAKIRARRWLRNACATGNDWLTGRPSLPVVRPPALGRGRRLVLQERLHPTPGPGHCEGDPTDQPDQDEGRERVDLTVDEPSHTHSQQQTDDVVGSETQQGP